IVRHVVQNGGGVIKAAVNKVSELVDDAVKRGARIRCGGQRSTDGGFYYPPTVLDNVPHDADMFHDEIFGPVAPIYVFDTEEDGVKMANDTEYGLIAYLFTQDVGRGMRVSTALDAGMVALNRGVLSDPAAPFGGVKQSG